ncbi:MAG: hypothetical protein PVH50_09955 [Anaerolineae bacterium]
MKMLGPDQEAVLDRAIGKALMEIYGTFEPSDQVWDRISCRVARSRETADQRPYRRPQPREAMARLEPQI